MMGMQCLSAYVFHIRVIQVISNQWETQMFHMDADLMCPAGLKLQRDQTVSVGFFYKSVMCDGFFTVFKINRAFDDGAFFSGKRSTDGSGAGVTLPFTMARYSRCTSRFLVIVERILPLTRCLDTTVRPEVSRSRRLQQRKMKGFPCS